jgi:hypothetical protein
VAVPDADADPEADKDAKYFRVAISGDIFPESFAAAAEITPGWIPDCWCPVTSKELLDGEAPPASKIEFLRGVA